MTQRKRRQYTKVEAPDKEQPAQPLPIAPPEPPKKIKGYVPLSPEHATKQRAAGRKHALTGQAAGDWRKRSTEWMEGFFDGVFERTKGM